jgi:hypothetical protein
MRSLLLIAVALTACNNTPMSPDGRFQAAGDSDVAINDVSFKGTFALGGDTADRTMSFFLWGSRLSAEAVALRRFDASFGLNQKLTRNADGTLEAHYDGRLDDAYRAESSGALSATLASDAEITSIRLYLFSRFDLRVERDGSHRFEAALVSADQTDELTLRSSGPTKFGCAETSGSSGAELDTTYCAAMFEGL